MRTTRPFVQRLARMASLLVASRRGATAIEYGLILALIVLAMIGALQGLGGSTAGIWSNVGSKVGNATGY